MEYSIKRLGTKDIALAQALISQWAKDDDIKDFKSPSNEHLKELLAKDTFYCLVALHGDLVVGGLTGYELTMFDKEERELFLFEIGVVTAYRQQGIARSLIEQLKTICLNEGIKVIFVCTELNNEAAKKLYASTGGSLELSPLYTYQLQ